MNFEDVIAFAVERHGSQMYGTKPYRYHLDKVDDIVVATLKEPKFRWHDHDVIRAAGYLHDIIEDTKTTWQELADRFGPRVASLVQIVTDEPGENRKERKLRTYPKIKAGGDAPILIKLGDRIANVEYSLDVKDSRFNMYFKEQPMFMRELYVPEDGLTTLWGRLNSCFVMQAYM